jgi:hypothetical protein
MACRPERPYHDACAGRNMNGCSSDAFMGAR